MTFRADSQKQAFIGQNSESGSAAERVITQVRKCVTLTKATGWTADLHDGVTPAAVTTAYYPDFRVRAIGIVGAANASVKFDLPDSDGITDNFIPGIEKPYWITSVDLSSATTATVIHLWG